MEVEDANVSMIEEQQSSEPSSSTFQFEPTNIGVVSTFFEPKALAMPYSHIEELGDEPIRDSGPISFDTSDPSAVPLDQPTATPFDETTQRQLADLSLKKRYPALLSRIIVRTRRKEKPRLHGPNPFGRVGCQRCELCRKHRQKVSQHLE